MTQSWRCNDNTHYQQWTRICENHDQNISRSNQELTKITDTKFIIVTHHALTMSRMNRLYGVTMPEKGISQLVAVDLQKAESMVA